MQGVDLVLKLSDSFGLSGAIRAYGDSLNLSKWGANKETRIEKGAQTMREIWSKRSANTQQTQGKRRANREKKKKKLNR